MKVVRGVMMGVTTSSYSVINDHSTSMTMISSWLEPKPVKEAEEGSAGFNTE